MEETQEYRGEWRTHKDTEREQAIITMELHIITEAVTEAADGCISMYQCGLHGIRSSGSTCTMQQ